jgi:hypothetical protein
MGRNEPVLVGQAQTTLDIHQLAVLALAGKFAARENLPEFYAWLRGQLPPELIPPADEIPGMIAEVSDALTRSACHVLAAPGPGGP